MHDENRYPALVYRLGAVQTPEVANVAVASSLADAVAVSMSRRALGRSRSTPPRYARGATVAFVVRGDVANLLGSFVQRPERQDSLAHRQDRRESGVLHDDRPAGSEIAGGPIS